MCKKLHFTDIFYRFNFVILASILICFLRTMKASEANTKMVGVVQASSELCASKSFS